MLTKWRLTFHTTFVCKIVITAWGAHNPCIVSHGPQEPESNHSRVRSIHACPPKTCVVSLMARQDHHQGVGVVQHKHIPPDTLLLWIMAGHLSGSCMDTLFRAVITYITEERVHIIYSFNRVMTLSLPFVLFQRSSFCSLTRWFCAPLCRLVVSANTR